jgi:DNA (cytosine-5)-methyltransferase 1
MRNYDNTTETITHVSLCSGYEGIGLGLRRVLPNLREIAYVEREGFAAANLVAKMEAGELDAAPVFTDVKTFPYGKFRGCVDILSGGFPCQPFSSAGKREGVEDPRHLFPYIAKGIRDCKPRIVFLENVEGIISSKTKDGESVLQYVLEELEGLGYRATAGIFSAREVGAPHQRKRVFILGYARSSEPSGIPSQQRKKGSEARESGELADSSSERLQRKLFSSGVNSERRKESDGPPSSSCRIRQNELADSDSRGGVEDRESTHLRAEGSVKSPIHRWPSRPGQAQEEWEEPRVIADSYTEVEGQAKSRLGRATDGSFSRVHPTANRVDRLRLLGNGVVPATAAKAFVTLLKRLDP